MMWAIIIAVSLGIWLYAWMLMWEYRESEKWKAKTLLEHRRRIMEGRHEEQDI